VLIIDDEDIARYLVRKLLSTLPAEIQEAHLGGEGLQFARENAVDLIVLDLVMPDASGFEIIAQLKNDPSTRDIPVVVHTSLSLGRAERDALSHAKAIVNKSRSEPELRDVAKMLITNAK
jgi:CheY-like chemotaxis protein